MTIGTATGLTTLAVSESESDAPTPLTAILGMARLRVLRATVAICLLISLGNLVGAIAGYTPSGRVTGPAVLLGAAWCGFWALVAVFPSVTTSCFRRWRAVAAVLGGATMVTAATTGGIDSPLLGVSMYTGWIASVVVAPRAALVMSLTITSSIVAGYLLAGDSVGDIFTGPYRYSAVSGAALPVLTGMVGVLLASVTNTIFSRLETTLDGLRHGLPATTPGLTALLAGRPVLELPAAPPRRSRRAAVDTPLTVAERAVVRALSEGYAPKQIAHMRGVGLSTVRSQLKRAKAKTGAKTLAELVRYTET